MTAALLWLAGPLVVGLGHLDGIDLPFTLGRPWLVTLALIRVLEIDRADPAARRRLLVLGLACGLAAGVKDTGLLLAALAPAVVLVSGWRGPTLDDRCSTPWRSWAWSPGRSSGSPTW